jgi:hypothetical protein
MRASIVTSEMRMMRHKKTKPNQIFTIRKIKNQKKWTREEDEMLISLAEQFNEKHWKEISKRFQKKNSLQCFSRYKRIRPGIVKGSWKREEDLKIIDLVNRHGKAWSKISKILGTRNGKQIRDRFINVLDPEIKKGKFTEEEDRKLVALFKQYGPKWATIAKYYPNRTADMIKNRFHSSIKKKVAFENGDKIDFSSIKEEYKVEKENSNTQLSHTSEQMTFQEKETCFNSNLGSRRPSNDLSASNNNFSIQSTFNFTKCGLSLMDSNSQNLYFHDLDTAEKEKNFTPSYSNNLESDFYPFNNNFNCDMMSIERDIKTEDVFYSGMFNFDEYFTI